VLTVEHEGESPLVVCVLFEASHKRGYDKYQVQKHFAGIETWPTTELECFGQLLTCGEESDETKLVD
jgi:hypothetical protein